MVNCNILFAQWRDLRSNLSPSSRVLEFKGEIGIKRHLYTIMTVHSKEVVKEWYDVLSGLKLMQETDFLGLIFSFASRESYFNSLSFRYLFDNSKYE